jgi:3-(3-hydroxy-phenyl)propionate hydroxylase
MRELPSADQAVVIVGGGPTGLMLAAELTLAGIDIVIIERRAGQEVESSRAGGLYARTIEVLDQRGVADRFLAEGKAMQVQGYAGIPLDISDFPTRYNYGLALWQRDIERILATWVLGDLEVPIRRGCEVVGFAQRDTGVDVELSDGTSVRAEYLVGCDGGRRAVRKAAGIEFAGWDPTVSFMIAEVEMDDEPQVGMRPEGGGIGPVDFEKDGGPYRVVLKEQEAEHISEPTVDDLRKAMVSAYGTDYGVHSPGWISRFGDTTRQAASYREGRVLLAGDAAHIHSPAGGQGLNTGVQDAVNLGWKLAQVVNGTSPDRLLDTYHAERHPVAARVLQNTMAQTALSNPDPRHQALKAAMTELLGMDEPRRRMAGMLTALDIHYDLGEGHPLLGRRMPDLDLHTADGPTRGLVRSAHTGLAGQALGTRQLGRGLAGRWQRMAEERGRVLVGDLAHGGRVQVPEVALDDPGGVRPRGVGMGVVALDHHVSRSEAGQHATHAPRVIEDAEPEVPGQHLARAQVALPVPTLLAGSRVVEHVVDPIRQHDNPADATLGEGDAQVGEPDADPRPQPVGGRDQRVGREQRGEQLERRIVTGDRRPPRRPRVQAHHGAGLLTGCEEGIPMARVQGGKPQLGRELGKADSLEAPCSIPADLVGGQRRVVQPCDLQRDDALGVATRPDLQVPVIPRPHAGQAQLRVLALGEHGTAEPRDE